VLKVHICVFLLLFTFFSCREEFIVNVDGEFEEIINLVAEMSSEEVVDLSLLRNVSLGEKFYDAEIEDAEIIFTSVEAPDREYEMSYDRDRKMYVLEDESYRIEGGQSYTLDIQVPNEDGTITEISAQTYVPEKVNANRVNILDREEIKVDGGILYSATVEMTLNDPKDLPAFFQVIPYRRFAMKERDNTGVWVTFDLDGRVAMPVAQILEDRNGVTTLYHKKGVYVDHSRLGENRITMEIQSERPLIGNEVMRTLEFDVITLSEDLYRYNVDLDTEIRNLQSNYSYPVNLYSNIENGQGVFGGAVFTTSTQQWGQ